MNRSPFSSATQSHSAMLSLTQVHGETVNSNGFGVTPASAARLAIGSAGALEGSLSSPDLPVSLLVPQKAFSQENRPRTSSQSARDFVARLAEESLQHRAVKHPYLEALGSGNLPDVRWALADFGRQYYGYSKGFPRYLTAVISRLEDPSHRAGLTENLNEESGLYPSEDLAELAEVGIEAEWIVGQPHPALFARFCKALGVRERGHSSDQITCWSEMFLSVLTHGSPAEAVGALGLGTENIISTIYQPFCSAIESLSNFSPRDGVFFPLHTAVDDHHQETLQGIAADLAIDENSRYELRRGMLKALYLRSSFWDWLYSRALSPLTADQIL